MASPVSEASMEVDSQPPWKPVGRLGATGARVSGLWKKGNRRKINSEDGEHPGGQVTQRKGGERQENRGGR